MTHVDDKYEYTPPPKPTFDELVRMAIKNDPIPVIPPVHHRLTEKEIDLDFPLEYRGADVLPCIMEALKQRPISMLITGPPGVGKTRQSWAMCRQERIIRAKALLIDGEVIDSSHYESHRMRHRNHWVDAKLIELGNADRIQIITEAGDIRGHRYKREILDDWAAWPRILIVDDIGFMEPSDWVREAIYHLANERRANSRRTIWTTNLDPDGLKAAFGAAIASRLMGGTIINLDGEDRRS